MFFNERDLMIDILKRFDNLADNLDHIRVCIKHAQKEAVYAAYPPYGDIEEARKKWTDSVWDRHEEVLDKIDNSIEEIKTLEDLLGRFRIVRGTDESAPDQLSWFN